MAFEYITKTGDTADFIAWKYYGRQDNRIVERLLDENPGLADIGPILPQGLVVSLPDLPVPAQQQGVRLWD